VGVAAAGLGVFSAQAIGAGPADLTTPITTVKLPPVTTAVPLPTTTTIVSTPPVTVSTPITTATIAATTVQVAPPPASTPTAPAAAVASTTPVAAVTTAVANTTLGVTTASTSVTAAPSRTTRQTSPSAAPTARETSATPRTASTAETAPRASSQPLWRSHTTAAAPRHDTYKSVRVRPAHARATKLVRAVRLRLHLLHGGRLRIEFVGPAPKCTVAARATRKTHKGANLLVIRARVGNTVLARGKYLLRLSFANGRHARRGLDVLPQRKVRALPAKAIALDCKRAAAPPAALAALASFRVTPFPPTAPKLPEGSRSGHGSFVPPPLLFSMPGPGRSPLTSALLIAATAAAVMLGVVGLLAFTGRLLRRIPR
jgi:hypothetical protein